MCVILSFPSFIHLACRLFTVNMSAGDMIWCGIFKSSEDMYSFVCILTIVGFFFCQWAKTVMEYITMTALSFWINFSLTKQGVAGNKLYSEENNSRSVIITDISSKTKKRNKRRKRKTRLDNVSEPSDQVTEGNEENDCPEDSIETGKVDDIDSDSDHKTITHHEIAEKETKLDDNSCGEDDKNSCNEDNNSEITTEEINDGDPGLKARVEDAEGGISDEDDWTVFVTRKTKRKNRVIIEEEKNILPPPECRENCKNRRQSARRVNDDDFDVERTISRYCRPGRPILQDFFSTELLNILNRTALPEVSPSPKKNNRRQRKKRNTNKAKFKSMDDSSDTSSTSDLSIKSCYVPPEKTTIYSPLPQYQKLNMDMYTLYHEFHNYLLTEDQLMRNGFPEESPANPGRILVLNPNLAKKSSERRCVRCSGTFNVNPDGTYEGDGMCHYHARKQQPYRRGHPYRGDYPCCNGNYMSKGCVTWQYHVTTECPLHELEFVKTKNKRHLNKVTSCSVYGLDCEMLYTTAGMEVAKVGVVSADGLTVFESFVLPQNQILDYNTVYSGITEKDLKGVTMTLFDVQAYLLKLLNEDSILVGHGLENDLRALRLIHRKVVDTSVVFPHEHTRYKKSLKNLAQEFLNKQIQTSSSGHNCIEDARTCMELMLCRIDLDLQERPPVTQDENKNSILQNTSVPASQPVEFSSPKYSTVYDPWPYSCNYSYCGNSYRGDSFYSGFLMPKNYQNSCIY